jgi:hypothetical protein
MSSSHLLPDGTTFPPVTPDPPAPPGYDEPVLLECGAEEQPESAVEQPESGAQQPESGTEQTEAGAQPADPPD